MHDSKDSTHGLRGFLPCSDNGPAIRDPAEQGTHICRLHDFKELVGSIVLEASYGSRGVEHRETIFIAERDDLRQFELLRSGIHEMVFLSEKDDSHYPPEIIDEIGVIELHAPPPGRWRETPQEQNLCMFGKERFERMTLSIGCHL